jgi:hypothetical protein
VDAEPLEYGEDKRVVGKIVCNTRLVTAVKIPKD